MVCVDDVARVERRLDALEPRDGIAGKTSVSGRSAKFA